jgi:uncharacterized protein (TIGR02001 family)
MFRSSLQACLSAGGYRGPALACLLVLAAPALAGEPVASDHGYRSLFKDRHWLITPADDYRAAPSQGLYQEEWRLDAEDGIPRADRYTGMRRRFDNGLGLDTGVAHYGIEPTAQRYREFYFGLSYDSWQGRVWYTSDYQGSGTPRSFYEFGVSSELSEDLSLSARLGYGDSGTGLDDENQAAYMLSAEKRDLYGFGLNLQLVGSGDAHRAEPEDLRVMGTLSRPFP